MESSTLKLFVRGLGLPASEEEDFLKSLNAGASARSGLVWFGEPAVSPFESTISLDIFPDYFQVIPSGERPGQHALHDEGAYYCLDLSSMFLSLPAILEAKGINNCLDLCASPGGKSAIISRAFSPEILVANETIRGRVGRLISNIKRLRIRALVLTRDSKFFAEKMNSAFDLVLVDAPCSGQSLLAKSKKQANPFHKSVINRCAMRQRRIIANGGASVRSGGFLLYMTCTYSKDENEEIVEWFLDKYPDFDAVDITQLKDFRSRYTEIPCYRLWPHQNLGAGGFSALLRRDGGERREPDIELLKTLSIFTFPSYSPEGINDPRKRRRNGGPPTFESFRRNRE